MSAGAAVVLATGSDPAQPAFPGGGRVLSVREALAGGVPPGARVLVIDALGRMQAASAADWLASRGHPVSVVGPDYAVGTHIDPTTRSVVERRLREGGVRALPGHEVTGLLDGAVRLRDCFTERERVLDGGDVVVADVGARPRDGLDGPLRAAGLEVHRVGDALAPRGLEEAYHEGYQAGLEV